MTIPDSVISLIDEEQKNQNGMFITDDVDYLEKLNKNAELLVHQDSSGVLGFVFFYCNAEDNKSSYISLICTSKHARGKGVGGGLLQSVLSVSKMRGFSFCKLEVRKNNIPALNLYTKYGFVIEEDRSDRYLMNIAMS